MYNNAGIERTKLKLDENLLFPKTNELKVGNETSEWNWDFLKYEDNKMKKASKTDRPDKNINY